MTVAIPEAAAVAEGTSASAGGNKVIQGTVVGSGTSSLRPRKPSPPAQTRPPRPVGSKKSAASDAASGYAAGRSSRKSGPSLSMGKGGGKTGTLVAELMIGLFIIWVSVFTATDKQYSDRMGSALWRSTALCGVFFVLALLARGPQTGKVAVTFGALVDLGIVFQATKENSFKAISDVMTGKGTGETNVQLDSDIKTEEPHEL
jgi:hypothetical protein